MRNKLYAFVLFVFLSYAFFISSGVSGNSTRTAALTWSLVNQSDLHIDAYQNLTVDKAFFQGHYYNAGEPGMSFLGVPVYFLYKTFREWINQSVNPAIIPDFFSIYVLRIFLVSLPSALLCIVLYDFLKHFPVLEGVRYRFLILYSFASPAFVYSTLFYRHQLSAVITFYVFYLIFTMKKYGHENHKIFLAGLLSSLNFFCDYASFIPHGILFLYFLINVDSWKRVGFYFAGIAPFLVCFLGYNYVCFGNGFHTGSSYSLITSEEVRGKNIFQFFLAFWKPNAGAFYGITFSSYRGLFYFFPLAIIPFIGVKHLIRYRGFRQEIFLFFTLIIIQVYFVSTLTDWMGALGSISRHLVLILPFFIPLIALAFSCYKFVFPVFALCSFCIAWLISISPYGEIPGEVTTPVFFVIKTAQNGFFRENLLNWITVLAFSSTLLYILALFSGILAFWNLNERNSVRP